MLNQFAVCGVLKGEPEFVSNGKYLKLKIVGDDGNGRSTEVEALAKEGPWFDDAIDGATVIVSGKLTGRVNDKGYLNMGLWAFDVQVVNVPRLTVPDRGRKPSEPESDDSDDSNIPF